MENIYTYMVYGGAALAVLGLIGLGLSVKMAFRLKKDAPEGQEAKDRLQLLVAINTASLGTAFIGLTLIAVGVLIG